MSFGICRRFIFCCFIAFVTCSYTGKEHKSEIPPEKLPESVDSRRSAHSLNVQDTQSEQIPAGASLADLESEPSTYIYGTVNVITGQFNDSHTDLVIDHGVDPISIERSFHGTTAREGALAPGWFLNHHVQIKELSKSERKKYQATLSVEDQGGPFCVFTESGVLRKSPTKISKFKVSKPFLEKAVSNTSFGCIGGQTSIKNWKLTNHDDKQYIIANGAGGTRIFQKQSDFRIIHESKPTGNSLRYSYQQKSESPFAISLVNRANKVVDQILLDPINDKLLRKTRSYQIHSKNGKWVRYHFSFDSKHSYTLDSVDHCDAPTEKYAYYYFSQEVGGLQTIWKKMLPDGRYLEADYYNAGQCTIAGQCVKIRSVDDPRIYRVSKLLAPLGADQSPVPICQLIYHLNKLPRKKNKPREVLNGYTDVYDALGNHSCYSYNENQRLTAIDRFLADGRHYTREALYWGALNSKDITNLMTRSLDLVGGGVVFARSYQYDSSGNVVVDSLYGNLSGNQQAAPVVASDGGVIQGQSDCYRKELNYSGDNFNLLMSESDGFQTTTYQYIPASNLLAAKFENSGTNCSKRWFYTYNDDAALTSEIVDDGSSLEKSNLTGVSERIITYYTQSQVTPVGYPLVIEQKCLDLSTGEENLIHKIVNVYNDHAKVVKQEHWDSLNHLAYTLYWEYDEKGNLIKESDALGNVITRNYDANGNCVFQHSSAADYHNKFTYDLMNRLIRHDEIHFRFIKKYFLHPFLQRL